MLENEEITKQITQNFHVFLTSLLVSLMTGWLAWKQGFFTWDPTYSKQGSIRGKDVLKAFFYFIFMQILLVPFLIGIVISFWQGYPLEPPFSHAMQGWTNVIITLGGLVGVFWVFFRLPKESRNTVWGDSSLWYKHLTLGALTWFIGYPLVLALNQFLEMVVFLIFQEERVDQVAVQHLRSMLSEPTLFWLTILTIVVLVPVLEELLFRGFLQSWLKMKFQSAISAILASSLIFAFFHFSISQGITNIELIASLFLLSCFLGFLYEKQKSLWASIGLHSCFNALSALMIMFE